MSAVTHAFEVGDQVCIVGTYRPEPGVGTVDSIATGNTYDVWVRFTDSVHSANATYPFRAEELALALDVEGAEALMTAMATEPIPTVTVGRRWSNPSHLAAMLGLGLVLGVITGVLSTPVQTVEVRTTVTQAQPPVCRWADAAGRIEMEQAKERDIQAGYARDATLAMVKAESEGNADEADKQHDLANAAALKRDAAELARIGAEQSFTAHAAACDTWKVAQRTTERVAQ